MLQTKKYESYKPSGVDFIENIPKHWEIRRVATIGRFYKGKGISKDLLTENGIPAILYGEIYTKYDIKTDIVNSSISNETSEKAFQIKKGDLLFTGSGETEEDIGKCIAYLGDDTVFAGGDIIILRPNSEDSLFLSYALNSHNSVHQKIVYAKGDIIVHIYGSTLREIFIPIPPLQEQEKIAQFLDIKNKEIKEFLLDKEEQIVLFKEQKEAIINKAITKGLNENTEFKYSGIEWIGDMPNHWEVQKLKYIGKIYNGSTPKSTNKDFWDGEIIWITPQDIGSTQNDYIADSSRKITKSGYDSCGAYLVPKDSIVLTTRAPIGNITIATTELCTNQGCKSIVVNEDSEHKFIYYMLIVSKKTLQSLGTGTTFLELSTVNLTSFYIPVPAQDEQKLIVEYIEKELSKIDELMTTLQKEIDLIQEYKISLINEVITGQIDVR